MTRLKRGALIALAISYVFLLVWAVPSARTWMRIRVIGLLGFGEHPGVESHPEDIPLAWFYPESMLIPTQKTLVDRPMFDTIEFHGHLFDPRESKEPKDLDPRLDKDRIRYFVNLDPRTATAEGYDKLKASTKDSPRVIHFGTFNFKRVPESDDFGALMAKDLEEMAAHGMQGVKLWKNFGLHIKTRDGKRLRMDDARLDLVWDVCAKHKLVIAIHTADPPAFWEKIDEKNERFEELSRHPEWSFRNSVFPKFNDLIAERESMFKRRRDVTFVALHFGELAHDLKKAAALLDGSPNVYFDLAQRIDELGRQPRAARDFLIKYQTRILYGIDGPPDYEKARIYWRFLETGDEYFNYYPPYKPRKGLWTISGVALPPAVLKKLYYDNAAALLHLK